MGRWLGATVAGRRRDPLALGAVVAAAVLMVCSGLIHIHLWDIAYRRVATLGPLFFVQAVAALVLAAAVAVTRVVAVVLGCAALMLGTVVGFVLADTVGLFGFTLPVVTGWAYEALVAEVVSSLLLTALVVRSWRSIGRPGYVHAVSPTGGKPVVGRS
jgi:xanthine/uracil permease